MRRSLLTILLLMLIPLAAQSQDTLRVYFGLDESVAANVSTLDPLVKKYNSSQKITVIGYADYLHNEVYNISLSKMRAEFVRKYLVKRGVPEKNIVITALGEKYSRENTAGDGEPGMRKVDVIISTNTAVLKKDEIKKQDAAIPVSKKKKPDLTDIDSLKEGESVELEGLSFIPGRHMILESSKQALQNLLKAMKEHPNLKIEIQGHVCCTTDRPDGLDYDTRTWNLSHNRAKAVYDFLVKNGIDKKRLRYKGFGGSRPKVPEYTTEDEQKNRRVEIMILKSEE